MTICLNWLSRERKRERETEKIGETRREESIAHCWFNIKMYINNKTKTKTKTKLIIALIGRIRRLIITIMISRLNIKMLTITEAVHVEQDHGGSRWFAVRDPDCSTRSRNTHVCMDGEG